jgi:hypothetical protein
MKKIKYYYYLAYVHYENGCQSVLGIRTVDSDYDLAVLHIQSWSRGFVGLSLTVDLMQCCSLKEYNAVVTRITW